MSEPTRFAVLGFGNMGRALVRGILKADLTPPNHVTVTARSPHRLEEARREFGVNATSDNRAAVERANTVILGMKPQNLQEVADGVRGSLTGDHLIISILAGKTTRSIAALLQAGDDAALPVIRVMPNIPVMVDAGCSPFARGEHATDAHVELVKALLASVGETAEVGEHLMDAVTGLSGSGPAYVYMMIEALTDGGVKMGIPRDVAIRLAAQTIYGAALVVKETGLHPAILRDQVTTPGGTAIAAISDLEKNGLRPMLISAVVTATERSENLSDA